MSPDDPGIAAGSSVERLLKTLRCERTDRVPNWELQIEARTVEHFVGKRLRSGALPVPDMVELALRTGMDAMGRSGWRSSRWGWRPPWSPWSRTPT
jgi:hypothetical protein